MKKSLEAHPKSKKLAATHAKLEKAYNAKNESDFTAALDKAKADKAVAWLLEEPAAAEISKTLATLNEAIEEFKQTPFYSKDFKNDPALARQAEKTMKEFFEQNDFATAIKTIYLQSVFEKGF